MQAKQQFTHVHEQHTMAVHTAGDIQHWLSSEALVGLSLVVGLSGLDEPVVPPSVGVLPAGTAAALLPGVAEDRQLLRCRKRAVATSIVLRVMHMQYPNIVQHMQTDECNYTGWWRWCTHDTRLLSIHDTWR